MELPLKTPSALLSDFEMCSFKNTIYVHDNGFFVQNSCEELARDFYQYNCEIDKWFFVPCTRNGRCGVSSSRNGFIGETAYLASDGTVMYGIGKPDGHGQFYDRRSNQWNILPEPSWEEEWNSHCLLEPLSICLQPNLTILNVIRFCYVSFSPRYFNSLTQKRLNKISTLVENV